MINVAEISRSLSFICVFRSNSYLFRRLQSWHFVGVFSVLVQRHFKSHARKKTKGVYILNEQYLTRHHHERRRMSSRRKNPHPKRAVNARTGLKVKEEQPPVLCSRIPDEDDDLEANHHQIQKEEEEGEEDEDKEDEEEITVRKGAKRKRGHECDVCEKVFRYPSYLARHMRTHTKDKPYECDVCEKRFSQSGHLQDHVRIHTNEKPYECDVCEKRFRQSHHLQSHKLIHTNEKPYECHVCEKRYRRSDHLKIHMRRYH